MGRELQKKKNRSSIAKVSRRKPKKTSRQFLANTIIAHNWDKSQTVAQNYHRLGLTRRLNGATGGIEMHTADTASTAPHTAPAPKRDTLAISSSISAQAPTTTTAIHHEARIERDPTTGAILRVLDDPSTSDPTPTPYHPLHDPLRALEDPAHAEQHAALAGPVAAVLAAGAAPPKKRSQSTREADWLRALVERHGAREDEGCFEAMARDAELNVRQQSAGDLRRRVRRYLAAGGRGGSGR